VEEQLDSRNSVLSRNFNGGFEKNHENFRQAIRCPNKIETGVPHFTPQTLTLKKIFSIRPSGAVLFNLIFLVYS
jgi:hypothetical protein